MSESTQQSRLKDLIAKGKEQNYLTYAEVNDHLPEDISDPEQVEDRAGAGLAPARETRRS